jgi:hypothetical protein
MDSWKSIPAISFMRAEIDEDSIERRYAGETQPKTIAEDTLREPIGDGNIARF